MIENMKVEFGRTSDIDSWMRLVRKVSWNFPGLETEQSIEEHKIIVLEFHSNHRYNLLFLLNCPHIREYEKISVNKILL